MNVWEVWSTSASRQDCVDLQNEFQQSNIWKQQQIEIIRYKTLNIVPIKLGLERKATVSYNVSPNLDLLPSQPCCPHLIVYAFNSSFGFLHITWSFKHLKLSIFKIDYYQ